MSLVATSWTTTRVAPTKSAPFAGLAYPLAAEKTSASETALVAKRSNFATNAFLALMGVGLLWFFLSPPTARDRGRYRWP
jgi:hypothetical protein